MIVYESDGFQVIEDHGWFYPLLYNKKQEEFFAIIDFMGNETQCSTLEDALHWEICVSSDSDTCVF